MVSASFATSHGLWREKNNSCSTAAWHSVDRNLNKSSEDDEEGKYTMSNINLTAGFPFNRGNWVGHTTSPFHSQSPFTATPSTSTQTSDTVQFSSAASDLLNSPGNTVTVKADDTLSQLLLDRGYSLKEMLAKDEQGKSMLDRVAADNKLANRDLIDPGQQLTLPSKERQDASALEQEEFCPCESDFGYETDDEYHQEFDFDFDYESNYDYDYDYDYDHGMIESDDELDSNYESDADCGCSDPLIGSESHGNDWESNYDSQSINFSEFASVLV